MRTEGRGCDCAGEEERGVPPPRGDVDEPREERGVRGGEPRERGEAGPGEVTRVFWTVLFIGVFRGGARGREGGERVGFCVWWILER